jgi:hypothetical protein
MVSMPLLNGVVKMLPERISIGLTHIHGRLTNLETDQESKSYYNRSVAAIRVVCGRGEDEIKVGQERAGIGDEGSSHGKHRSN